MSLRINNPTPFAEVNEMVQKLLRNVQGVLKDRLIGMYLEGSLANGDFDQDSDIDFIIVTDVDISKKLFSALQKMHERIATTNSQYAKQLEGSYILQSALQRFDPKKTNFPNIERGIGERLKMVCHDDTWGWIIHRYIMRERGITVLGPPPQTLIDPISSIDLQQAMLIVLQGWATQILNDPDKLSNRGYQSYTVLSLCRILYTLRLGDVASKPKAALWAKETTDEKWKPLIDRAWTGRQYPKLEVAKIDLNLTLEFIRYAIECGQQIRLLSEP